MSKAMSKVSSKSKYAITPFSSMTQPYHLPQGSSLISDTITKHLSEMTTKLNKLKLEIESERKTITEKKEAKHTNTYIEQAKKTVSSKQGMLQRLESKISELQQEKELFLKQFELNMSLTLKKIEDVKSVIERNEQYVDDQTSKLMSKEVVSPKLNKITIQYDKEWKDYCDFTKQVAKDLGFKEQKTELEMMEWELQESRKRIEEEKKAIEERKRKEQQDKERAREEAEKQRRIAEQLERERQDRRRQELLEEERRRQEEEEEEEEEEEQEQPFNTEEEEEQEEQEQPFNTDDEDDPVKRSVRHMDIEEINRRQMEARGIYARPEPSKEEYIAMCIRASQREWEGLQSTLTRQVEEDTKKFNNDDDDWSDEEELLELARQKAKEQRERERQRKLEMSSIPSFTPHVSVPPPVIKKTVADIKKKNLREKEVAPNIRLYSCPSSYP